MQQSIRGTPIKPKSTTPKKTTSESPPKISLKPALKSVMKTQVATKKKDLKLLNSMPEIQDQRPPPSIRADKYCWYSKCKWTNTFL